MQLVQKMAGMQSSTATIPDSVELLVLNFCLVDVKIGKPLPKETPPPVCPLMLGCTPKDPYTYHLMIPLVLALRIRGSSLVPCRYFIIWVSLAKLS